MSDKILIVEDEDNVRLILTQTLIGAAYDVLSVSTVSEAVQLVRLRCFDAIVLDLAVGTENGMDVARAARQRCPYSAIIVLTGHGSLESAIEAVDLRAQAYLLKPTSPDDLVACVTDHIARMREEAQRDQLASHLQSAIQMVMHSPEERENCIEDGGFCLNLSRRRLTYQHRPIEVTAAEFDMLRVLMANKGTTVSALQLAHEALGYNVTDTQAPGLIRSHIARIRFKIESDAHNPRYLLTLRGHGYMWVGE